ncbi:cytochrome c biogenesis CcdA family protein [Thermococcus gammatolerans]|uniref:Cytochrome C biogenesis protein n=1 Tax=Thermococcus gammatolerans (strain DSM 15229 / JCM 11827 / EJ3) TaxID=593117 RepID=C5A6E9_THEGJ|nr:cytochrome c biogenesis CcdA family protein [Thermococcus gammatolerans]ACS33811.1 Cytochrome C biogenesis protein [Thermococcus gammatolerans EJ3]
MPAEILRRGEFKYLLLIIVLSFGISAVVLSLIGMAYFIPQFLSLALTDSVNPCTFAVYTLFLIALSVKGVDKRRLYLVGLSFVIAVYISYYTLGLGLTFIAGRIPLRWAGYFAIAFGIYTIATGIAERSRTGDKRALRRKMFSTDTTVIGALILGISVSTTLLPCSAGPYLVYAAVIARSSTAMVFLLLALYNLIFVLPLLTILFAMGSLRESKEFSRAMVRHSAELSVIAGLLLIAIGIWLLGIFKL